MPQETERRILLSPPDVGEAEKEALLRAFDGGWIAPLGPEVDAFEAELAAYVDAPACAALSSGSAALELGLRAVGVEAGDEVVVQSATFAASAFAVVHVGATPVFCDVDANSWGLDLEVLERFLVARAGRGRLPAAIMPVDLYGMCGDYRALRGITERYDLPIVEDAAEGLGSSCGPAMAGSLGDVAAFSFNGNKIITTSGGGALTGSADVVDRVRHLATQARQPVAHFEHAEVGFNYRLSNLLAALGRAQLAGLDRKIERRHTIFERYRAELPTIDWLSSSTTGRSNHWLSVGLLDEGIDPAEFCRRLGGAGIEARQAFKPMHRQPVFEGAELIGDGAVADRLFDRGVCLPSGSTLTDDDQAFIIERVQAELAKSTADESGAGTVSSTPSRT
jgi:dTDP-4-amino-4,6-dideoxygalactose transaminase